MTKTWIIADTHFGHRNIIEFEREHRPFATIEEHDEALIERWNRVVAPEDTVWHLGDVGLGGKRQLAEVLRRLNGRKKLVLGNHDQYGPLFYAEHFARVYGVAKVHEYALSHAPLAIEQQYRFKANIHGHTHSHQMRNSWYVSVSCEQQDLTPRLLQDVFKEIDWKRCGMDEGGQ